MATLEMKVTTAFETISCYSCAMAFAVPRQWQTARRNDHRGFWCPNGHSQSYMAESEAERLKRELDAAQRATASARESLANERTSHSATKGQLTKVKNRIEKGVCPQCNRHFVNVERHMGTQHGGKL